jgi:LPS export ABC transporter protein LptC
MMALCLYDCSEQTQVAANSDQGKKNAYPDQESWNTILKITNEGVLAGVLKEGHIQKYSKKGYTLLKKNIQIDFFNKNGGHTSALTASQGKIWDNAQDMHAYGNVIVQSDSGIVLYTDTLEWDNKNQKIISRIPVKITTEEGDTLYGDSFSSNPALTNYHIKNPHGVSSKVINAQQ